MWDDCYHKNSLIINARTGNVNVPLTLNSNLSTPWVDLQRCARLQGEILDDGGSNVSGGSVGLFLGHAGDDEWNQMYEQLVEDYRAHNREYFCWTTSQERLSPRKRLAQLAPATTFLLLLSGAEVDFLTNNVIDWPSSDWVSIS